MRSKFLAAICGCALGCQVASADIFFTETFPYSNGALTSVSGGNWTAHSAGGSKPMQVSSGQAIVVQSSGSGEDLNRGVGQAMGAGDVWYFGFDVTVSGTNAVAETVYFAHLLEGTSTFGARVFVTAPGGSTGYRFGISESSTLEAIWGSDFVLGTTHRVVVCYDYDSRLSQMWIDPANMSSASISTTTAGAFSVEAVAFALRQNTGGDSSQVIDELIVADNFNQAAKVPTPASLGLLLPGLLVGSRRRR